MWTLLVLSLLAQADDILADEAKSKSKSAAPPPAAAPVVPASAPPSVPAPAATPPAATGPAPQGSAKAGESGESAPADGAASDAESGASSEAKPAESSWLGDLMNSAAMGYLRRGGFFMWPILILGIVAFGVIIERFRALSMINSRNEALRSQVRELLEADRIEDALLLCERNVGPVPAILGAGLKKYLVARRLGYDAAAVRDQVIRGMDDYAIHIVAAMERHLPILATVSSAAPMIGFLGTVSGMVTSFDEIVRTMGEKNIVEAAAAGIMVSLLTTVLGLIVGIPSYIAFNYFTSTVNSFVLDVEESAAELIEAVTFQMAEVNQPRVPETAVVERAT